jgi:hypothetical protein
MRRPFLLVKLADVLPGDELYLRGRSGSCRGIVAKVGGAFAWRRALCRPGSGMGVAGPGDSFVFVRRVSP